MMRALRSDARAGMTVIEVLLAVMLVGATAAAVYGGGFSAYKAMMRSRARLEAQGIASDQLWFLFNTPYEDLPSISISGQLQTPEQSFFSTNGLVRYAVMPESNDPIHRIDYWEVRVQVWAPRNSPLFAVLDSDGSLVADYPDPLVDYSVLRYRGER